MRSGENLARISLGASCSMRSSMPQATSVMNATGTPCPVLLLLNQITTDDVARLPDQEMIVAHGGELAQLRQDRGLDAPRIAQALQDEQVGGGGALFASSSSVRSL